MKDKLPFTFASINPGICSNWGHNFSRSRYTVSVKGEAVVYMHFVSPDEVNIDIQLEFACFVEKLEEEKAF
ncbi:Hypothetical predicted protein [Octopus vulgaris]|uniref:Uncharacterized protein n=1 Tax=Octopus vulgaris TaxID=6645 RepID=A0AA36BFC3_OCTVU|nr:Hypothetical predicted protein [Octopus vulgaris]